MKIDDLVRRAEELIQLGLKAKQTNKGRNQSIWVECEIFYTFRASSLSFLSNIFSAQHCYYTEFSKTVDAPHLDKTESGIGIIKAVKNELEGGWLTSAKGLISAEIFSDFIEMADHLLSENYKDAAAVTLGSVLEEHLRTLASINGVETKYEKDGKLLPKKADRINADLAGANIYTKLDQKNVTAWLGLRNSAAHGQYDLYTLDQVKIMRSSLVDFMARNS